MIERTLILFCVYLASGITAWQYFSALFGRKRKLWQAVLGVCLGYICAWLAFDFTTVWVNALCFTIINFLLLILFFSVSWKGALFHAGILSCLILTAETASEFALGSLFGDASLYQENMLFLAVLGVVSRLLYFFATKVCIHIIAKKPSDLSEAGPEVLLLGSFSVATIFILVVIVQTVLQVELPPNIVNLMLIGSLILLFSNFLVFAGYQFNQHLHRRYVALQLAHQREEDKELYFRTLEEQYNGQQILLHDINRHLAAIKALADENGDAAVAEYMSELQELPALQRRVRFCENSMLNVILSEYYNICRKKGIDFLVDVRNRPFDTIKHSDVTALLGNLLENAVEAAENCEEPYIELHIDTQPGYSLFLSLVNTCAVPPQSDGGNGFVSKKTGKLLHGIGLQSIRQIIKKYHGEIRQEYEEETHLFTTNVLLK